MKLEGYLIFTLENLCDRNEERGLIFHSAYARIEDAVGEVKKLYNEQAMTAIILRAVTIPK